MSEAPASSISCACAGVIIPPAPIIGAGGIMTPAQAQEMLDAGASLIEIYTGFIYNGPGFVEKILKHLEKNITNKQ